MGCARARSQVRAFELKQEYVSEDEYLTLEEADPATLSNGTMTAPEASC